MDVIAELQKWYANECDGDWEHSYGVRIDTLNNSGWEIKINLEDTYKYLEEKDFTPLKIERDDNDWLFCEKIEIEDGVIFQCSGGPGNLVEMLTLFLNWANGD